MSEVQAPGFESDDVYNLRREQRREAMGVDVACVFTMTQLRTIFELFYQGQPVIPANDVYWFCQDPENAIKVLADEYE